MIRVLIVSETPADYETTATLRRLTGTPVPGLRVEHLALPPAGATVAAALRVSRRVETGGMDVLHAFGSRALLAVSAAGCQPIVYTPPPGEPTRRFGRLRRVAALRAVCVACNGRVARAELVAAGVDPSRVTVMRPQPPDPPASVVTERAALGFAPTDRIILAVGESTRSARHEHAIWSAVILHYLDRRYRLLLWARGEATDRVRRFADALQQPGLCVFAPPALDWPDVARLADVAVWSAIRAAPMLALHATAAAGVPLLDIARMRPRVAAQTLLRWFERPHARPTIESRPDESDAPSGYDWPQLYADALVGRLGPGPTATTPVVRCAG